MGKYIIEIEDKPFHKEDGDFLYRVKGFNSLVFDMNGIGKLTPYTEPDLEQVKDETYNEGYKAGREAEKARQPDLEQVRKEGYDKGYHAGYSKYLNKSYEDGLADAWEAARKIWQSDIYLRIFKVPMRMDCFTKFSASEAIEKIRQYEQEQDAEIKVGDEVELKCGVRPAIYMQGTKGSDEIYLLFNDGSCGVHSKSEIVRKTGRHFPEIAAVLEKMRGEQDG